MFELGEEGVRALNLSPSIITVGPALASFSINYCVAINNPRHHGGGRGREESRGELVPVRKVRVSVLISHCQPYIFITNTDPSLTIYFFAVASLLTFYPCIIIIFTTQLFYSLRNFFQQQQQH